MYCLRQLRGVPACRWAIAVLASVLPEAGPLGVLESMAAGLPVVATDLGGAAEYLSDGVGVLVAPGDPAALAHALSNLIANPARRDLRTLPIPGTPAALGK